MTSEYSSDKLITLLAKRYWFIRRWPFVRAQDVHQVPREQRSPAAMIRPSSE